MGKLWKPFETEPGSGPYDPSVVEGYKNRRHGVDGRKGVAGVDGRQYRLSHAEVREEWILGTAEDGKKLAIPMALVEHAWSIGGEPTVGQGILSALAVYSTIGLVTILAAAAF